MRDTGQYFSALLFTCLAVVTPGTLVLCVVVIIFHSIIRAKVGVLNMRFVSSLFFRTPEACLGHPHGEVQH